MYSAIGVEPTKLSACTRGSSSKASTATLSPWTTLNTPSGNPAFFSRPAMNNAADGSRSDGFSTKVLPQASATGNIHSGTIAGKLNGVMPATTPNGAYSVHESTSRPTFIECSPLSRCGMPQANSTTSSPRVTSPRASDSTLPCSDVMIFARSPACASSSSLKRNITRARFSGVVAAHAGKAAAAASTARFTSAAEASGTRAVTRPVAGSKTSPKRSPVPAAVCPLMKWEIASAMADYLVESLAPRAGRGCPEGG